MQHGEDPHEAVTLNALNALYSLNQSCNFPDEVKLHYRLVF